MSMSKRTLLIGTTLVAAALSTDAVAQASRQKSKTVTQVGSIPKRATLTSPTAR
jgi:hypothetical protein